jgi:hypothetical protein
VSVLAVGAGEKRDGSFMFGCTLNGIHLVLLLTLARLGLGVVESCGEWMVWVVCTDMKSDDNSRFLTGSTLLHSVERQSAMGRCGVDHLDGDSTSINSSPINPSASSPIYQLVASS